MTFQIAGKQLRTSEGKTLEFECPIQEVAEVSDVLVVLLHVSPKVPMTENVFGVSQAGRIMWQVERIPEAAKNPYTGIFRPKGTTVKLYNWNGTGVEVDVRTGKVVGTSFCPR